MPVPYNIITGISQRGENYVKEDFSMIKLKNRAIALALAGAVLFTTAAAADFLAGDAYTGAKKAVKETCAFLADKAPSVTIDAGYNVLFDQEVLLTGAATNKYDFDAYRTEVSSTETDESGTYEVWRYEDEECSVRYSAYEDTYYVYPYGLSRDYAILYNPFEDEMTDDLEKVFDAFVGNLKEFVNSKDNGDGVLYYGELDSTQVPALPNTLAAFVTKYSFNDDYTLDRFGMPYLSEIAVDSVTASMEVNEDNVIESAEGALVMVGYDEEGNEHTLRFEAFFKLYDINSTDVSEFDRSGKTIVDEPDWTVEETATTYTIKFDDNDIGTYKTNLVELTDNGYEKTGEIVITFDDVDGDTVTGTYENSETGESAEFAASAISEEEYLFNTDEDCYVISKRFDYDMEVPSGITLFTGVVQEEYGWYSQDDTHILTRSFE